MEPNRRPTGYVPPADGTIKTLAVDDQESFRAALRDLVGGTQGFMLVGEACSGEEAIWTVDQLLPQLVLMDVVMPGIGGITAAQVILERRPHLIVVLLSVDDPSSYPGVGSLGGRVVCSRKQDLRPARLRELWELPRS